MQSAASTCTNNLRHCSSFRLIKTSFQKPREILTFARFSYQGGSQMVDLTTTYLGLKLKNPLVASASPLSKNIDAVKRLEDANASAVVMFSLFEEQIIHESEELDYHLDHGTESFAEAITYLPDLKTYNLAPQKYLELVRKLKDSVEIPVIASLNGATLGGWEHYAKL